MKQDKTFQYITVVLLAAIFLLSLTVVFDNNANQLGDAINAVQVEGQAQGEYKPELFRINIGVQQEGNDVVMLENDVTTTANDVQEALLNVGVNEADILRQTYSVNPQNSFQRERSGNQYTASQTLYLEVENISLINDVLRVAIDAGANNVNSLSIDLTQETKDEVRQELLQEAVSNAKIQAENAVNAAGKTVGEPISIQVDQRFNIYRATTFDVGMESQGARPNIQPGVVEQTANVRISYEIN